jgi:4-alpha-glucanotransferase
MVDHGLLKEAEIPKPRFMLRRVDFKKVTAFKKRLFHRAYERFKKRGKDRDYEKFCSEHAYWLDDFALFVALKKHLHGEVWNQWPVELRDRQKKALQRAREDLYEHIEMTKFLQYIFYKQWMSLKQYCSEKKIHIIGDIPIYVNYDSVDVWTHPEIFTLDNKKRPSVVAGVPPDYFSDTGQFWGNPLYRWDVLQKRNYDWWIERFAHNLQLFDIVRIDHFRGLVAYWEIPATEKTAINGQWVKAPVYDFFNRLKQRFSHLPVIAEDLGTITPDVHEVMRHFKFVGMKVLLFAFGEDNPMQPYLPHTYEKNYVVYTGTHDNNTVQGWFKQEARVEDKKRLFRYLGQTLPAEKLHWALIRLAMMSVANLSIFTMQDILGLGAQARMNRPATSKRNWQWRLSSKALTPVLAEKLGDMVSLYGRI